MDLIIVESPSKAKKIEKMLGGQYRVLASLGHIRDLPGKSMGLEYPDWRIKYQITDTGKKAFSQIKKLADQANNVYLAADLDREGEAIAWHLAVMLKIPPENARRIKYSEITKKAVTQALANPEPIDVARVRSQEARRVLDRIVGYTVSPLLSRAHKMKLSAGRVQSVAVRLIVERFNENRNFKPQDYFGAEIQLNGFAAQWNEKPFLADGEKYNFDRDLAEAAAGVEAVTVSDVSVKPATKKPPAPFTTSSMQQAASKILKLPLDRVMKLAQELYEGSFITYLRTDSTELSEEAIDDIRAFASSKSMPLPDKPNRYPNRDKNAQEAHEAIRPTNMAMESVDGVSEDAAALYELIHKQALVCQLAPARVEKTQVVLVSQDGDYEYRAKGERVLAQGFMAVTGPQDDQLLPQLNEGMNLEVVEGKVLDKKTTAPALFTEGSLVNKMEKLGIGRPATYASILSNIKKRGYIKPEKGKLVATDTGQLLVQSLKPFHFMDYGFTAELEEAIDEVAQGNKAYRECVTEAFQVVFEDLQHHLGFEDEPEALFLPPQKRDYPASEKQVTLAEKMAQALEMDLEGVDLASGRAVSEFLEKHAAAYKKTFKPTEKQLAYAEKIAGELEVELPVDVQTSAVALSAWIDRHRDQALNRKPPSEKQLAFAQRLADEKDIELPQACREGMKACSDFIDKHQSGRSRKKSKKPTKKG